MKLFAIRFVIAALAAITLITTVPSAVQAGYSSVDIINYGLNSPMWVHCKSGDNDLHWQLLQIGQDYHFQFHENIIMNTVFWCRFVWGPSYKYWQTFTVWDREHWWDMPLECGNCVWRSQIDGMYIWDSTKQTWDFWKPWISNGPVTFTNETNPPTASWENSALEANQGGEN